VPAIASVRDRRRAETVREIKAAALDQLAEAGPGGMSLRGVARAVGMTVQSLYHYFDSRDALLSVLVREGHDALADAVQAAADATRGQPPVERRLAATLAFRAWAHANRPAFLLLYGTPVPGFEPAPDAGTGAAAGRLAAPFAEVVFDGWTPAQLAALALPPGGESLAEVARFELPPAGPGEAPDAGAGLPPAALALFLELRARMHGLVMLELLGHLVPLQDRAEALFVAAMHRMSAELDALRGD
jgi:AcrR family transcriptional regulator